MAQSALVSLMNTLELILRSELFHFFHVKQQVIRLYRKARLLRKLLQDSPQESSQGETNSMEMRIRDSAYAVEDMVERCISEQIITLASAESFFERFALVPHDENSSGLELEEAVEEIDLIVEELLKDRCGLKCLLPSKYSQVASSRTARSGKIEMVGFDDDAIRLKDRLTGGEARLQAIPIVGMGGTGKTTLATNLYDDSLVKYYFDVRAWVTISQTYLAHDVIRSLLKDIGVPISSKQQENIIEELRESLYQNLKGRRYFIVLDDMWNTDVWDNLKRIFPDDANGSRVLLTTRLLEVAVHSTDSSSPPHQMQLLNMDKSWELLRREVFKKKDCPSELEDLGKMIARSCRGLPLAISVVGGLLANSNMRVVWEYLAENVHSLAVKSNEHCYEILSLSYNNLPYHLKPCFLYFGAFPEDHVISVTKLIRLWIAEGFLEPIRSKSLERVAEEYLNELIDRNLVFVCRKGSNGKTRTCIMHDLLRDLCIKEARKENFLHIIGRSAPSSEDVPSRLILHLDILEDNDITDDMRATMESAKSVRSLLCTGRVLLAFPLLQGLTLLRVLDLLGAEFMGFPSVVLILVNLRYLALGVGHRHRLTFLVIPSEISLLWKLQILIVQKRRSLVDQERFPFKDSPCQIDMPSKILQMTQLRHLQVPEFSLPDPVDCGHNSVVLKDLQTLATVKNFRCTKEFLKKCPNLRKLALYYGLANGEDCSYYHLKNLVHLSKLEHLKCIFRRTPNGYLLSNLIFPQSLRKLTLSGGMLLWKDMTIIGSLPHLEVLKLKRYAFWNTRWEPNEGEFCRLKFLLIDGSNLVKWMAENTHFPCLEHLILRRCYDLQEIPSSIGEIATLKTIWIDEISRSAVYSALHILEEQRSLENYVLQVLLDGMEIVTT